MVMLLLEERGRNKAKDIETSKAVVKQASSDSVVEMNDNPARKRAI